jgi:hypothetical protein
MHGGESGHGVVAIRPSVSVVVWVLAGFFRFELGSFRFGGCIAAILLAPRPFAEAEGRHL